MGQLPQQVGAIAGSAEDARAQRRHEDLAFARRDGVGERCQRLRIHEGHRAADDDQGMAGGALGGPARNAGEAQQREHVDIVPLERHRERHDVEVADRRLRFERHERRLGREQLLQLLFGRQEHPLAHDVIFGVEEPVDRLEPEVRHSDPVGVRKGERHAQTIAVRLLDVADFLRKGELCALALFPGFHAVIRPVLRRVEASGRSGSDVGVLVCRGSIYSTTANAGRGRISPFLTSKERRHVERRADRIEVGTRHRLVGRPRSGRIASASCAGCIGRRGSRQRGDHRTPGGVRNRRRAASEPPPGSSSSGRRAIDMRRRHRRRGGRLRLLQVRA